MRFVLDTDALFHQPLFAALARARLAGVLERGIIDPILPAPAYAQRLRQFRRDGRDPRDLRLSLELAGVRVEAFGQSEAERATAHEVDDEVWRKHGRDFLIAGHVSEGPTAVTRDAGPAWARFRRITPEDATALVLGFVPRRR